MAETSTKKRRKNLLQKKSATKASASHSNKTSLSKITLWLKTSVWAFPVVLFIFVCVLTALRLSGTSVGIYHDTLYGDSQQDPNLLYGEPRPIRSDEWLSTTQIIASQELNGLPRFNEDLGTGRDVSLQPEVPYLDWTTIFRPHTWSHVLLPLEFAFAFRWWFITYMVIISCYLFTLYILPNKKLIAILVSLAFGLSPFIHWWYQTAVSGTLAFGFMILLLSMKAIDNKKIFKKGRHLDSLLNITGLVFFMVAFGLILYPPFLIPVAIVILFFILGYLLNKKVNESADWRYISRKVGLLAFSATIAGLIGLLFIFTRQDVISSITGTVYPGERIITSGGDLIVRQFSEHLMSILYSSNRGPNFLSNQSESANFISYIPHLIIPTFIVLFLYYRQNKRVLWVLLSVQAVILMLLARAYLPIDGLFYDILLLDRVPHHRLLIGLGLAGLIQIVLLIKSMPLIKLRKPYFVFVYAYSALTLVSTFLATKVIADRYSEFVSIGLQSILFSVLFSLFVLAFLLRKFAIALVVLLVFSVGSVFKINPVYQGLGFVSNNEVSQKINDLSSEEDNWATVDNLYFNSIAALGDRSSISGVQIYPDTSFWENLGGEKYEEKYNRQGHLIFTSDPMADSPFNLVAGNYLQVKLECSEFIREEIQFVVSTSPLTTPCITPLDTVSYPKVTFYLYRVD